jgi:hypothetical protein
VFDPVLEEISDKIRMGEPVGLLEALAAINYQEALKRHKRERACKVLLSRIEELEKLKDDQ